MQSVINVITIVINNDTIHGNNDTVQFFFSILRF